MTRILTSLLVIATILGVGFTVSEAAALSSRGTDAPVTAAVASPPEPCSPSDTDLLIQDDVPWPGVIPGSQDPQGAFVNELKAQNKAWCSINSVSIGTTNLSQFDVIIIASDQAQSFYDNLFPGGVIHPSINSWVLAGGILSASLADCGHNLGGWTSSACLSDATNSYTFIGGVKHTNTFSQDESIITPAHPLIADALPCPSNNCAVQTDTGVQTDIDGWFSSDHGFFTSLPGGAIVILADSAGNPVAVEYAHGSGTVIANMNTDAWRYHFGNLKYVANDIAYQNKLGKDVGGAILPISSTALLVAGLGSSLVIIPIAAGSAGLGIYLLKTRLGKNP